MIYLTPKPSQSGGLNKKRNKKGFLTPPDRVIKKDPRKIIIEPANELKVHKKTVRTSIKQDLSPDLNHLDIAIWDILKNKTNATSHLNIGSLKTAIDKEWNKISDEFFEGI